VIAGNHVRSCIALTGLGVLLVACAAPDRAPSQSAANPIVRASIGAAALSWVEFADGRTAVSDDAGLSWRALRAPQPPASGASVALSGNTLTVVALSGSTLTVQRSGDDGVSWKTDAHELSQPADSANVAASPDGRTVAVAASLPGAAGATDGHAQLLVGPANGDLAERAAPGAADIAWSGHRLLMPGGPMRSRLYLSADEGQTWAAQPVAGPVAPDHDVPADAPVFGQPVSTGAGAVVPVTSYAGLQAQATLYRTADGARFDQLGELPLGDEVGPGVGVTASRYGDDGVIVADPFSTILHVFTDSSETSVAGAGLPGPVDSLTFQNATDGLAQVTVRGCTKGKDDCIEELRVYRTSDGGASWERSTP